MRENPITNEAQAKTAEKYADYLAGELRVGDAGEEEMDRILNRMIEIAHDLADFREGAEWVEPIAKLVVHNRFPKLSNVKRPDLRLVANTNTVNGESQC